MTDLFRPLIIRLSFSAKYKNPNRSPLQKPSAAAKERGGGFWKHKPCVQFYSSAAVLSTFFLKRDIWPKYCKFLVSLGSSADWDTSENTVAIQVELSDDNIDDDGEKKKENEEDDDDDEDGKSSSLLSAVRMDWMFSDSEPDEPPNSPKQVKESLEVTTMYIVHRGALSKTNNISLRFPHFGLVAFF